MLPLLLPRPLLWLLLQLPAAKHHGPKARTESKIYVSRGGTSLLKSPTRSLPLLLPQPLLWLLPRLPAAKHNVPKGRTESKMYVS